MPGFRLEEAIRSRINGLRQLCGENPASAFSAQFDLLPILRDPSGWTAIRPDGLLVFVDDTTGRALTSLPDEWRALALTRLRERYPEIAALLGVSS